LYRGGLRGVEGCSGARCEVGMGGSEESGSGNSREALQLAMLKLMWAVSAAYNIYGHEWKTM